MKKYRHYRCKKHDFSKLFNKDDEAKMAYNEDMLFRIFVREWHKDAPELLSWTLTDFFTAYNDGAYQLELSL